MPLDGSVGYSSETARKQHDLAYVLEPLLRIARSPKCMGAAWASDVYHYVDLNAGRGVVNGQPGSPLVFLRQALELGHVRPFRFRAWLFELDDGACSALREALIDELQDFWLESRGHSSRACDGCIGCDRWRAGEWLAERVRIVPGDHNETVPAVLDAELPTVQRWTYGLTYADPNGMNDLPLEPMRLLAKRLPRVDQLVNVSATTYKRVRAVWHPERYLLDELATIDKRVRLIRAPVGRQQWTMVLATNYAGFPHFPRIGFHRLDSAEGREIARRVNFRKDDAA